MILGTLLGLLGGPAAADVHKGLQAYDRGDYETAVRELQRSADAGDPQGLYNLGVVYAEGKALPRDMTKAVALYRASARRGSPLAAYNLAQALRRGDGTAADFGEAARWYAFAAERGDYRAANELGLLYVEGNGVTRDLVEGFAWIYPATHADIMDEMALANAVRLARMLTPEQLREAQARGRRYHERYIKPHMSLVRSLLGR